MWEHVTRYTIAYHKTMMSEKSGPLENGSSEERFVLMDEDGVTRGGAETYWKARERRDEVEYSGRVYIIHETREVVPNPIMNAKDLVNYWREKFGKIPRVITGDTDE